MAGPKKVSKEEYDEFRSRMETKYGYDEMSDEEKADFDAKIDQVAVVGDKTDAGDEDESDHGDTPDRGGPSRDDDDEDIR